MDHPPLFVLIENDDDEVLFFTSAIKELNAGVELLRASDGEDGLALVESLLRSGSVPGLIVLDVNMPKIDGKETASELKKFEELKTVPIIAFTTSSSPADKAFFDDLGIEMVTKPIEFTAYKRAVKTLINHCRS